MAIEISTIKGASGAKEKKSGTNSLSEFLNRDISLGSGFSDKKKESFYTDLKTLAHAGVDLRTAFELILEEPRKKKEHEIIHGIHQKIVAGKSFSQALEHSGVFSPYECVSIRIGEETGNLNHVLEQLAVYYYKRIALKRQLTKVFSYPVFVILLSLGVVYFMMRYIVPMFSVIFKRFGSELPTMTQKVVFLSDVFVAYSPIVLIGMLVFFIVAFSQRKKVWFRRITGNMILRIPFFGDMIRKVYLSRFCQSMEMLVSSKTNLLEALELVEQMIGFYPLETAIRQIRSEVARGDKLSLCMSRHKLFDKKLISLIKVAEEVNALEDMFGKLNKQYTEEVDHRTATLGTIMEPLLMVVIGSIVGFILIALYLPMFNLGGAIK